MVFLIKILKKKLTIKKVKKHFESGNLIPEHLCKLDKEGFIDNVDSLKSVAFIKYKGMSFVGVYDYSKCEASLYLNGEVRITPLSSRKTKEMQ